MFENLKVYDFKNAHWSKDDFVRGVGFFSDELTSFEQCDGNIKNNEAKENFEYTSISTKKLYSSKLKLTANCLFESFGAPLILLGIKREPFTDGYYKYEHIYEIVAYKDGINIWELQNYDEQLTKKVAFLNFKVEENKKFKFEVTINNDKIVSKINENILECELQLPQEIFVGITACEGLNKFYDFSIEELL